MLCCLNPDCAKPLNQDTHKYCQSCGNALSPLLRNRFRIIRPLGQGGFGKTYLAEDTDKLKEQCVVKQLVYQAQGSQANKIVVDLFMREAEQLQQLWANPQIPSLFAYFEEEGYLYLVQQYVEGQDLLKELEHQGAFSNEKILALLRDLLPLLDAIHSKNVIHRDIKPENIMRRSNDGQLILIDFGVSKQLSKSIVSMAGTMVGSLGYAAPEQMESGLAQPASDLYSLGVSCFHLMTGIMPWNLWKKQGYGWLTQWRQHLQQPVSPELGLVLDKLLQLETADRYQTASAVLTDLIPQSPAAPKSSPPPQQSQASQNPTTGTSQSPFPQSPPQSAPTPSPATPTTIYSSDGSYPQTHPTPQISPTQQPRGKHRRQALMVTAIGVVSVSCLAYFLVAGNTGQSGNDPTVEQAESTDSPLPASDDRLASAENWKEKGDKKKDEGNFQGAIDDYTQAIKFNPEYASAYFNRGFAYSQLKQYDKAIADYTQAIKFNPAYADAYNNRGFAYNQLKQYDEAIADYTQAIKFNPEYASAYFNRGFAYNQLKQYDKAIADYTQAIKFKPEDADAYNNRGKNYADLKQYDEAIADFTQAIKFKPEDADAYYNRGNIYHELKQYDEAIADFTQAIKFNPEYADAYYNRGDTYEQMGNFTAAKQDFQKAASLDQQQNNSLGHQDAVERLQKLQNR